MGEKFAKHMVAIFVVIEIGMFTQEGVLRDVEVGRLVATQFSLFLVIGIIYSSTIALFLVFFNPLMAKYIQVIGYIGAFLFVAAMMIYGHYQSAAHLLNLLGIITIPIYLIAIIVEDIPFNPRKRS